MRDHHKRMRQLFWDELAVTSDPEVRTVFTRAIEAGPTTAEWSHAIAVLGIRHAGEKHVPLVGWQDRVWERIAAGEQMPSWWSRNRPYLCAAGIGLLVGTAFTILAWGWL